MDACFNAKQAGYESDPWVGAAVGAGLGGLAGLAGRCGETHSRIRK
jgi:hypothetical protein